MSCPCPLVLLEMKSKRRNKKARRFPLQALPILELETILERVLQIALLEIKQAVHAATRDRKRWTSEAP